MAEQLPGGVPPLVRDPARLALLQRTLLLDSPAELAFDRLTRIAARVLRVPVALVSLVDQDRQFFKSAVGLPEPWGSQHETPSSHSFCQHVVASGEPLIIADATQNPLVSDNLAIPGLHVVAYAGVPLITADGHALGSFCAIDSLPREWTADEVAVLRELAAAAVTEIELRVAAKEAQLRADEAERERSEKAAILESITDAFFALDHAWRFVYVNAEAERVLQRPRIALIGKCVWTEFPEAVGSHFEQEYRRAVADQVTVTFETWYPPLDILVDVRANPTPEGLSVYFHDITERKRVEAALRESHMRREFVLESSKIGEWELDLSTGKTQRTLMHDQCFGALEPIAEWSYEIFLSYVHPDDRAEVERRFGEAISEHKEWNFQCRVVWADTSVHWIQAKGHFYRDDNENASRMVGIVTDITEQKEAEEALRESEARLQAVADLVPDLLWSNDPGGVTDWYNRRWLDYTGQTLAEARGYGWLDAIHPDDRESSLRNFQAAIEDGDPLRQEHRIRGADGGYRWFLVQAQLLKDEAAQIVRWYGAATDVHNERVALEVAQAAQAEAEAALEARDDFMSMLSHDLKQPLGVIQAYTSLAQRRLRRADTHTPARIADSLGKIEAAANRMTQFINELLDVARLQAGKLLDLTLSPTDLVVLVRRVVAEHQQTTERHRLHVAALVSELAGDYDATRLERVLANLLSNAIKYSPEGGTITISIMGEVEGADGWSVIEVRDEGMGIPAADLPYIFERFRRGTNVVGKIGGSGIGLTGAQRIVEQHGGTIGVESVEGHGATFTVRLPLVAHADV